MDIASAPLLQILHGRLGGGKIDRPRKVRKKGAAQRGARFPPQTCESATGKLSGNIQCNGPRVAGQAEPTVGEWIKRHGSSRGPRFSGRGPTVPRFLKPRDLACPMTLPVPPRPKARPTSYRLQQGALPLKLEPPASSPDLNWHLFWLCVLKKSKREKRYHHHSQILPNNENKRPPLHSIPVSIPTPRDQTSSPATRLRDKKKKHLRTHSGQTAAANLSPFTSATDPRNISGSQQ